MHDIPPFYQLQVGEESQHGIAGLEDLSPGFSLRSKLVEENCMDLYGMV